MSYQLQIEIYYIELFHIAAICISILFFVIMYYKAQRGALLYSLFYVNATMLLWMIAKVLKTVSPNVDLRWFFIVLQYLAICLLEVSFLEFSYCYKSGKTIPMKYRKYLYILPMIQFLTVATNPLHHLFYATYDFYEDTFGTAFYFSMIIEYFYILSGIILCTMKLNHLIHEKKKLHIILIGLAIMAPLIINILFITYTIDHLLLLIGIVFDVFDVTPIAFTVSLIIFIYTTFKYSFLDLMPIMHHEILNNLLTPIIITDENNNILDKNKAAGNIVKYISKEQITDFSTYEKEQMIVINQKTYKISCKFIQGGGNYNKKSFNVYVFLDITRLNQIREELTDKLQQIRKQNLMLEKKIEILKDTSNIAARNYFSRELHDVIGHALVLTMRLCEAAIIVYEEDTELSKDKVREAMKAVKHGFNEIKTNLTENNINGFSSNELKREIEALTDKIKHTGLDTKLYFRGISSNINYVIYETVIHVIKEALTNTLKYSKATSVIISVSMGQQIMVIIADNGVGCTELNKGNGITGLEQRVISVNGKIDLSFEENNGFQVTVKLPNR